MKGIDLNIDLSGGAMQGWRQNYELANAFHGNGNSPEYLLEDRWHRADLYDPNSEWILDVIQLFVKVSSAIITKIAILAT